MRIDDSLNKLFDIETPVKLEDKENQVSEILPNIALPTLPDTTAKKEDDFSLARDAIRNLVSKNEDVINDLINIAKQSESPRAFEVVGKLIDSQTSLARGLLDLHKQKRDIDGDKGGQNKINTQNNIVFAGSTAELMKMISAERSNIVNTE